MFAKKNKMLFFFQAEDGIRDATVTGVQTCALPIFKAASKKTLEMDLDDRPELEAGLETYAKDRRPQVKPVGSGYFPVFQKDTGYYISGTSVVGDGSLSALNAHHYLNSVSVPYAVWATHWNNVSIGGKRVQLGDFGLAIENSTGASMGFVYGDGGTPNKVGECSQKLHNALGHGVGLVTFIAFPGSGSGPRVPLGPSPQALIPVKVLMNSLKLHTNAAELAARLAMGRELPVSKKTADMSPGQAHLYKNFMSALSNWTIPR